MARALQPGHTRHDTRTRMPQFALRAASVAVLRPLACPPCFFLLGGRDGRRESTCACTLSRRGTRALLPCRAPPTCQERALKLGAAAAAPARAHARWGGPLLRSPGAREGGDRHPTVGSVQSAHRSHRWIRARGRGSSGIPLWLMSTLDISRLPLRECVELGSGCGRGLGCKLRTVSISRPARQIGSTAVWRRAVKLLASF